MGDEETLGNWLPTPAPLYLHRFDNSRHFDNSVNAVSFGFVATAILISMFLVMAIFERFLRSNSPALSPSGGRTRRDLESQISFNRKLANPASPKMSMYASGVSVLMPGEDMPTFIARPAPVRCPPERTPRPLCQHNSVPNFAAGSISNTSSNSS
ncbi:uncharacterized protein At5g65660-like [Malania oleifera]|uniref:uncharacterized protein At5g65660-like n=1 Tax=Malania oleifera TaxID=397392 RepID=UPI0025ADED3E|nr:uncharacterized protein At5g65660-like [Malania oleifera]